MGPSSFKFFLWAPYTSFSARVRFGRSRSSKVIDFGTNRKRVCHFLLVRHINLGPILHRFRDITDFCAHDSTPIPPEFRGVPVGPDRRCWVQLEQKLKLISREIIFEIFQPMTNRQVDGRLSVVSQRYA